MTDRVIVTTAGDGRDPLVADLRAAGVTVEGDADLSSCTTLKVGGRARALVTAESVADLAAVADACERHGVGWTVLGRGSNLLVSDDGLGGVAIVLGRGLRGVTREGDALEVGAAEPMPTLAVRTAREGLGGLAWAAGVPGAVGGAVRMNAGAHGGDVSDTLQEAVLFRMGSRTPERWPAHLLGFGYRRSRLPSDAVVIGARFGLTPAPADEVLDEIREIKAWRRANQPINRPNCGSVFTNPDGDSAGRLIDTCGLKGHTSGGAEVSTVHANFITTSPGATANDVVAVIRHVQETVLEAHGVLLHPEVRLLGWFDARPHTADELRP